MKHHLFGLLLLFSLGSITHVSAQQYKYIDVYDSVSGKSYHLKLNHTRVRVKGIHNVRPYKGHIVEVDSFAVTLDYQRVDYRQIEWIAFRPYWKGVAYMNGIYYVSAVNLFLLAGYEFVGGGYGAGMALAIMTISSPIWAGLIPAALNLIAYGIKPDIVIHHPAFTNFKPNEKL